MAGQGELFAAPLQPPGLRYRPDLISPHEETGLAEAIGALEFEPFDFHGHLAARHVAFFGRRYDYARRALLDAPPIPDFLLPLRALAADFAGVAPGAFEHLLINRYAPGAGIGWHRDKAQFGLVVGVSLLTPCTLRFRLKAGESWRRLGVEIAPRSAYLLDGEARWSWEHSIRPTERLRYSITFRTLAEGS